MKSIKVRFLKIHTVAAKDGVTYPVGSVHLLPEHAAQHFIRRGTAELCPEDTPVSDPPRVFQSVRPAQTEERELTSTVNLISAFNRARMQSVAQDVKPPDPVKEESAPDAVEAKPEPEPTPEPEPEPEPQPAINLVEDPLVSCVMPTWNRRPFIKAAIACWLEQTYKNRELVVLDDGDDPVRDLVPRKKGIRYFRIDKRESTGTKRNHVNELAKGEIICHWDDDDWSDPTRIERQVKLIRESGKPVTGYSNILYWNVLKDEPRLYVSTVKGYICGGTMCYLKSWWEKHRFPDKAKASDNAVIYPNIKDIAASLDLGMYVARAHDTNIGGDKKDVGAPISKDKIPEAFWKNEELRQVSAGRHLDK